MIHNDTRSQENIWTHTTKKINTVTFKHARLNKHTNEYLKLHTIINTIKKKSMQGCMHHYASPQNSLTNSFTNTKTNVNKDKKGR